MTKLDELFSIARFIGSHPLTREARLAAWWRFGVWQLRSRLSDEVIVHWLAGQRLAARRGMRGATGNIYAGLHEFADMMMALHLLRPGDLFFDVGANVGSYTVLAAGVRRAHSWAFEPDPDTAAALRRNLALNRLEDLVRVHEIAVGDHAGEVSFTSGLDTVNRVIDGAEIPTRRVRQEPLDRVLGEETPLMVKIDVEGHEEAVLHGASGLLSRPGLRVLELETVTPWITGALAEAGFTRLSYDPFTRQLSEGSPVHTAANALFVRDRDWVAERLRAAQPVQVLGHEI